MKRGNMRKNANTNVTVPEALVWENTSSNVRVQDHIVSKTAHQTEVHNKQAFALEIKCWNEANLRHGRHVSSEDAAKTEIQGARRVAFWIMNGFVNGAISDNCDVLELLCTSVTVPKSRVVPIPRSPARRAVASVTGQRPRVNQ
jgi:hypothetical protein